MNVSCTTCEAVYRVDPALVPHGGVRARCASCGAVLQVRDGAVSAVPPVPAFAAASAASAASRAVTGRIRATVTMPLSVAILESDPEAAPDGFEEAVVEPFAVAARFTPLEPTPAIAPFPSIAPTPPTFRPPPTPIVQDVAARARRLARALVSDMVAYRPVDRAQGLRDGTLAARFRDEIARSRAEYVRMVGAEVAAGSTHFEDALNDLLADGAKLF